MTHENKDYIQILRSKGYRVTPQRLIVLDAVCDLEGHATLADIHARVVELDSTIDRSTIYRALDVLREVGLIVESEIGEKGKIYRVAGEANHHHLVCLSCGNILTLDHDIIQPLLQRVHETYDFTIHADHLVFNGICKACQNH